MKTQTPEVKHFSTMVLDFKNLERYGIDAKIDNVVEGKVIVKFSQAPGPIFDPLFTATMVDLLGEVEAVRLLDKYAEKVHRATVIALITKE